jgi:type I restriction enzyme S subunit
MAYKQVLLGDYFKFEKGLGYKGEFLVEDSEVALIGMDSHEEGGGYKEGSEKYYSGPFKEEHVAQIGDVIFAGTEQGFGLLGSPLIVPENEEISTYLFSGDVLKAVPLKPDDFSTEYLYNIYRVEKYRRKVAYGDTGTTVRRVSNDNFAEQLVPLPDLKTQESINEVISLIDQQIENNKFLAKNLETLAQSILRSWFVDFEPVHAKARGEKPFGMDEETAALFPNSFEESEIGLIPISWQTKPLDEMCTYLNGLALQKYPASSLEDSLPVIKISQLKSGDISKADRASSSIKDKYIIQNGDILFSWSATLEVEHWVSGPGALNQHLFKVTGNDIPDWLAYLATKDSLPKFREIAREKATSMGHIQRTHLTDEKYAIPKRELLDRISTVISPLINQKIELLVANGHLRELRTVVLSELISGNSRLSEQFLQ